MRAIANGAISGVIATAIVYVLLLLAKTFSTASKIA
jgi:hypothetical protein